MILFILHNHSLRKGLASSFDRWGNWDSEWEDYLHIVLPCHHIVTLGAASSFLPHSCVNSPQWHFSRGGLWLECCWAVCSTSSGVAARARSISRDCDWLSEEGPNCHSKSSLEKCLATPGALLFQLKNVQLLLWWEMAASLRGTNCKSFLVSTLSRAFSFQFLTKAWGWQIKMSNSCCAAEHTDSGYHAATLKASYLSFFL